MKKNIIVTTILLLVTILSGNAQTARNFLVLRSDGSVDQYSLFNHPIITFNGEQIAVGEKVYASDQVLRFEYGYSAQGLKKKIKNSANEPKAIYIYQNNGEFCAFYQNNIERITNVNLDTLEISSEGMVFKIPISAIDSIGLHPFETVYNSDVVRLAQYEPYVVSASIDKQTIEFSSNLPAKMRPKQGDILLQETFTSTFPNGYAGRVVSSNGNKYTTEIVTLDDIFNRVLLSGELSSATQLQNKKSGSASIKKSSPTKAMAASPSAQSNSSSKSSEPEQGISIDLEEKTLGVSYGPASASFKFDLTPKFYVFIVKNDSRIPSSVYALTSIDASVLTNLSLSTGYTPEPFKGPTLTPFAEVVIPACPIVSVGMDITPYLGFSVEGKMSASASCGGKLVISALYHNGEIHCDHSFNSSLQFLGADAEIEGKVSGGLDISTTIQITGGILGLGTNFKIGPAFAVTLPLTAQGEVNKVYDLLVDSKLNVALEGKFGLIAKAFRTKIGSDKLEFPFSFYSQDYYFVPHFTKPECSPVTISRVGMASVVSREDPLLMGVNVGFDVSDGRSWTFHDKFKGEDSRRMNTSFTGFEYDTKYTVTPFVEIFGAHISANPTSDFIIRKEEKPDNDDELKPHTAIDTVNYQGTFGGYRFEWKDSEGSHGFIDRKAGVYQSYTKNKNDDGITHKYNDNDKTYAEKWDSDGRWWVEDSEFEDNNENVMESSRYFYDSYIKGRKEARQEANGLWNVFSDALGGLAFFEEDFHRKYYQGFGRENGDKHLAEDYVGTGTICGIKCLIYDNQKLFKRWPTHAKVWVDPATGLCLRYELDGGEYWFEVTSFRIGNGKL